MNMLQVNFIMTYIIHKILLLLKKNFKMLFKEYIRLLEKKTNFFSQYVTMKI